MKEYHKIQSIFKRYKDGKFRGKFIEGQWSLTEFEYLADNQWCWDEKIDGTNIRVIWDGNRVSFNGKTDRAQMPILLLHKLQEIFTPEKMIGAFSNTPTCLYGEGYGAKIQKGGNYISDGVDFILFDVLIDGWWLRPANVDEVARKLGIRTVPCLGTGTLTEALRYTEKGFISVFGNFQAEGLVLRPKVGLFSRNGHRIITKVKCKDFE